jgi:uncharacterized membrane protein
LRYVQPFLTMLINYALFNVWLMKPIQLEGKIDSQLEVLLDRFEKEVEPYDRLSSVFLLLTPIGVILSVLIPILIISYSSHANPFTALVSEGILFWTVGAMLATLGITKAGILLIDHQKHVVSRSKYKPLTGVCMCDLSQLRSHLRQMEKARTVGERLRHTKLANYYQEQIGWKNCQECH